jgi:hypothetical protein
MSAAVEGLTLIMFKLEHNPKGWELMSEAEKKLALSALKLASQVMQEVEDRELARERLKSLRLRHRLAAFCPFL